jgi:hypothetical protein
MAWIECKNLNLVKQIINRNYKTVGFKICRQGTILDHTFGYTAESFKDRIDLFPYERIWFIKSGCTTKIYNVFYGVNNP